MALTYAVPGMFYSSLTLYLSFLLHLFPVVANDGLKTLSVWYYQGKRRSGASSKLSRGAQTLEVSNGTNRVVASVVPGDFDGDNDLDLAVFLHDSSLGKLFLHFYKLKPHFFNTISSNSSTRSRKFP